MSFRPPDPATSRRARTAARWAIAVGITGFLLKFSGWMMTKSDAVLSDALESIVNIVASVGAYLALRYADRPPDEQHPYGHGGIEFVSALFEGVLVAVAGLVILTHCVESALRGGLVIERIDVGFALVALSAVLNGITGWMLLRIGRATSSAALVGDGRHLLSDLWTTFAVLVGLILVWSTGLTWIDTAIAAAVGVWLIVVGAKGAMASLSSILGEQDASDHRAIVEVLEQHKNGAEPAICSYASVRHRHQGRMHFIDMHLRVHRTMSVASSHDIASTLEREVLRVVGEGTATAHMEPCGDSACARCMGAAGRVSER